MFASEVCACIRAECARIRHGGVYAKSVRTVENMAVLPASEGPTSRSASPREVDFLREIMATTGRTVGQQLCPRTRVWRSLANSMTAAANDEATRTWGVNTDAGESTSGAGVKVGSLVVSISEVRYSRGEFPVNAVVLVLSYSHCRRRVTGFSWRRGVCDG